MLSHNKTEKTHIHRHGYNREPERREYDGEREKEKCKNYFLLWVCVCVCSLVSLNEGKKVVARKIGKGDWQIQQSNTQIQTYTNTHMHRQINFRRINAQTKPSLVAIIHVVHSTVLSMLKDTYT